jgi:hypothetical protein
VGGAAGPDPRDPANHEFALNLRALGYTNGLSSSSSFLASGKYDVSYSLSPVFILKNFFLVFLFSWAILGFELEALHWVGKSI